MTFQDKTGWDDALRHGITTWNTNGRTIQLAITKKSAPNRVLDYHNSGDGVVAFWRCSDKVLKFNTASMRELTTRNRRGTGAHELGHALQLGDHDGSQWQNILMYYAVNGVLNPQPHDLKDYRSVWGPVVVYRPRRSAPGVAMDYYEPCHYASQPENVSCTPEHMDGEDEYNRTQAQDPQQPVPTINTELPADTDTGLEPYCIVVGAEEVCL